MTAAAATDSKAPVGTQTALAPERLTYRVEEVSEIMGVTDSTVWKWLRKSGLPSRRINRVRLIRRVDLEEFIDAMPASRGGSKGG